MIGYRRLLNNATAALVGRFAAIAVSATLATVLFRVLGAERYGVWALLTLLAGYSTLIDFGLSSAVERRVASLVAHSSDAQIAATLNTSLTALAVVVSAMQVVALIVMALPSMSFLDPGTRRAMAALPLCSGMTLAALSAGAVLAGQQRMVVLYVSRTIGLVVGSAAVIAAALNGVIALDALLVLYTAGSLVTFWLVWYSIRGTVPGLRLRPQWERAAVHDLFWFGGVVQFATMVPPIAEYAFRLIVSARFGLAYSGVYDLGARAAIVPRSLAGSLFTTMIPFAVQTERHGGGAGVRELVRTTVRHVSLFILPVSAVLVAFSGPLVRVWLGDVPLLEQVRLCFVLLLLAHAAAGVAVPAAMVGRALARPVPEAVCTGAAFVAAVVLAQFAPSLGVATALLWGLPAVGGFVCWVWLDRISGIGFASSTDLAATLAVAAGAFVLSDALLPAGIAPMRVLGSLTLAGLVAVASAFGVELGLRRWRGARFAASEREFSR